MFHEKLFLVILSTPSSDWTVKKLLLATIMKLSTHQWELNIIPVRCWTSTHLRCQHHQLTNFCKCLRLEQKFILNLTLVIKQTTYSIQLCHLPLVFLPKQLNFHVRRLCQIISQISSYTEQNKFRQKRLTWKTQICRQRKTQLKQPSSYLYLTKWL